MRRFLPILSALLLFMLAGPLGAYPIKDRSLLPEPVTILVPFSAIEDIGTFYLPTEWKSEQQGERWTFSVQKDSAPVPLSAELRTGRDFRTFREFVGTILPTGEQERIVGPIGFPDKFNDTRERWFLHFIRNGRMLTAVYGSVIDVRTETATALEMVFYTDDFDYFDSLSYAIICNASVPGRRDIREIQCYRKCIAVHECSGLRVPLSRSTPEEAVTAYYGCLITNRWKGPAHTWHAQSMYGPRAMILPIRKDAGGD